ncbi:hypothetical protein QBC40DRAFT_195301 [Triangularia verruculosa]|uniref:Uncharacterized protein n=1 Tax=Triangularia verruculosa TaxID=2587418 RepID=A0AAN7AZC7_9PEZI|nr:hypothetical protein QBC40DRAFT_195301 [Triangularia verruculosa]
MCYQLVERYSRCRCLYYQHAVDRCAAHGRVGHPVQRRNIFVGDVCADHDGHETSGAEGTGEHGSSAPSLRGRYVVYSKQIEQSDDPTPEKSSIANSTSGFAVAPHHDLATTYPGNESGEFSWIETPVQYDWDDSDAESATSDSASIISAPSTVSSVDPDTVEVVFHRLLNFQDLKFLWSHTVQLSGSRSKSNHNIARFLQLYAIDLLTLASKTDSSLEKSVKLDAARYIRKSRRDLAQRITEAHFRALPVFFVVADNEITNYEEVGNTDHGFDDSGTEDGTFQLVTAVAEAFLFETDPILHLQSNVRVFVNRQCPKVVDQSIWQVIHTKASNFVSKLRQEPLAHGKKRITWSCKCGKDLHDDFVEVVPGAIEQLEAELRYQNTIQPDLELDNLEPYNDSESQPNASTRRVSRIWTDLTQAFRKLQHPLLPKHRAPRANMSLELGNPCPQSSQQTLPVAHHFLLLCIPFLRFATRLFQPEVCQINSDQAFFQLLRLQYSNARMQKSWLWGQLRRVQAIHFVKLELYSTQDLVDICHSPSLPRDTDPYVYSPQPPEHIPPIGANHLMHLFSHPSHAEPLPILLRRVPKKVDNPLKACPVRGVGFGWGLHLEEGMNWSALFLYGCIGFGLSLLMAVLWAVVINKGDVQGGFAIGGFMVAFCGFAGGLVAHMNGGDHGL